ncbi:hypothetical protein bcCo53_001140 (plasmid) [Borrelia coriaceae]|nr:hypothetical protein [Borrelia coriaceae]UPA16972.1 hypothetical protein bcCo53_001140 [Borrelia coriaceae]
MIKISFHIFILSVLGLVMFGCAPDRIPVSSSAVVSVKPTPIEIGSIVHHSDENSDERDGSLVEEEPEKVQVVKAVNILREKIAKFNESLRNAYYKFEKGEKNSAYFNAQITFVHDHFTNDWYDARPNEDSFKIHQDRNMIYPALGYDVRAISHVQLIVNELTGPNAIRLDAMYAEELLDCIHDMFVHVRSVVDEGIGILRPDHLDVLENKASLQDIAYLQEKLDCLFKKRLELIEDIKILLAATVTKLGDNQKMRNKFSETIVGSSAPIYLKIYSYAVDGKPSNIIDMQGLSNDIKYKVINIAPELEFYH